MIAYKFSRLGFRADVIESLADHDFFEIVTPEGTFRMTKLDFRTTFANVVKTESYQKRGLYHYPRVPKKALTFLVA
jgi:hypothetical protein